MLLRNLCIGYKKSAPIVNAIDAELCLGEFVCLTGRNGTGKSTLLRTLADLQAPLSGEVIIDSPAGDAQFSKQNCAIVLTQTPDLHNTTVRQMVAWGRLPYTGIFGHLKQKDLDIADRAIHTIGIEELAERNFASLSDGERQKTMIARALAQGTDYLLLDEPSAFLDHPSKLELMRTLRELAHQEQEAVLLSTHDLELAEQFADKIWNIQEKKLSISVLLRSQPDSIDL